MKFCNCRRILDIYSQGLLKRKLRGGCLVGYECWGHMVATLAASAEDAEEELSGF